MKVMKRISAVLLSLCLAVPCFSMVVSAADGRISFTDPDTAVGEYVEVKCVVRSTSGNMGDIEVALTYDEEYLRFDSGDGITADGNGQITCAGDAGSAEVSFVAKFQALKEGSTKVEIAEATISDTNGLELTLDEGSSAVTIAAGDPSKIVEGEDAAETAPISSAADQQVDVNGVTYTLTDEFADADIPNGYSRTQRSLDGAERQMVENDNGSICLGYMLDAEGTGDFFLYNEENATFSPYAEITISDMASIVVLSDASQVSLPDNYQEAKLSLNGKEFPVWQNIDKEGCYVIYAMNNNGEVGFYQYDSEEGTYQRFEPETAEVATEEEETDTSSILGKVQKFIEDHMSLVILVVGLGGILGILILIILGVKLHNRNAELDELYDEYGIDLEEEEKPVKKETKKESKKARKQKKEVIEEDFDDFEEEYEDFEEEDEDFEEEDYEDDFEEVEVEEDYEDDFEDFRETEEEEFTGYTERLDFTIDDLDELLGEKPSKRRGHFDEDDTFKVDFIDLD